MKKFLLLYKGPATPPDASHDGWPQWFNKLEDKLVDRGLPMAHGRSFSTGQTLVAVLASCPISPAFS